MTILTLMSDLEEDKRCKASLVLAVMNLSCTPTSENKVMRAYADALYNGKKVEIENVAGGYTNYTYKLSLPATVEDQPSSSPASSADASENSESGTSLFAKVCFPRAMWNPDPDCHYDLERTENEYTMMKHFSRLAPGCVPEPYFCADVHDMKVLVSQFCPGDTLAWQLIDGVVDMRIARELPVAIAKLHLSELGDDFNDKARECMIATFPLMESHVLGLLEEDTTTSTTSRAAALAKEYGPILCSELFQRCTDNYRAQDIPCHTDLHGLNILVTPRQDTNADIEGREESDAGGESSLAKPSFVVCDWEMAMVGPLGLDQGRFYCVPIAAILVHTLNGTARGGSRLTKEFLRYLDVYWESYASAMKEMGDKNDEFLLRSYRNGMGWTGWKLHALDAMDWLGAFIPLDDEKKAEIDIVRDALSVLGMKLMRWGFCNHEPDLDLKQLQRRFFDTLKEELSVVETKARQFKRKGGTSGERRRSSARRRVSDGFQAMTAIAQAKRRSIDEMYERESAFQKRSSIKMDKNAFSS